MKFKRAIYLSVGCLGCVLGAVGAVLPLLPSFPFLMLAAWCFAKSSQKLHNWFVHTNLYKKNLESYVQGRGMTLSTKLRIILMVSGLMGIGFVMMHNVPVGRVLLVLWSENLEGRVVVFKKATRKVSFKTLLVAFQ